MAVVDDMAVFKSFNPVCLAVLWLRLATPEMKMPSMVRCFTNLFFVEIV